LTPQAAFAGRDGAGLLAFNSRLWLLGGWRWPSNGLPADWNGYETTSEVWSSANGDTWTLETVAPWEGRHMSGWAVLNGSLYVVGGDVNHGHYQPNVWSSSDGKNWTEVANDVPWGERGLHYTVSFNGALYVIGGQQLPAFLNPPPSPYPTAPVYYDDVWRSTDGAHWSQVGTIPHALGMICGSAVFNGELWVIGGGTYGDDTLGVAGEAYSEVWSSADGVHWTQHANAPWPMRRYHNLTVFDGELFVMAGIGNDGSGDKADVWYSADGDTWKELPSTPWVARHAASATVLNGVLYLTGGTDDGQLQHNDVWTLKPFDP
jgi:N-acetylneuraminic acid mutarotase